MRRFLIAAVLGLCGCKKTDAKGDPVPQTAQNSLYVYPDSANGVVCYSTSGYKDISCVKVR